MSTKCDLKVVCHLSLSMHFVCHLIVITIVVNLITLHHASSLTSSLTSASSPQTSDQLVYSEQSSFLFLRSLIARSTPAMASVAQSLTASFPSINIMTGASGTSVSVAFRNGSDLTRNSKDNNNLEIPNSLPHPSIAMSPKNKNNKNRTTPDSFASRPSFNDIVSDMLPGWAKWKNGTSENKEEKPETLPLYSSEFTNISTYSNIWPNRDNITTSLTDQNKPFEVTIKNDKTMAYLKFDQQGRDLVKCLLYDLEKDQSAAGRVSAQNKKQPTLQANFPTLLEAIRRCTRLTRKQLGPLIPTINSTTSQINESNTTFASTTNIENSTLVHDGNPPNNNTNTKYPWTDGAQNFVSLWKGILPGTKWCGMGDTASSWDDLGTKVDVDICCRAHDHCPIRLKAFRMDYGLINFSFYTKSHCDCDADFYRCLKKSPNSYGTMLGNFYFNVLKVQCIQYQKQPVCIKKRKNDKGIEECVQYEMSNEDNKMKIIPFEFSFT